MQMLWDATALPPTSPETTMALVSQRALWGLMVPHETLELRTFLKWEQKPGVCGYLGVWGGGWMDLGEPRARADHSHSFRGCKARSGLFYRGGEMVRLHISEPFLNHPVTLGWVQLSSHFFWIKFGQERSCLIFWLSFAQEVKANCNEGITAGEPPNKWEAYIDWQPACHFGDKCIFIHCCSRSLSALVACCLSDHASHIFILSNSNGWCKILLVED